MVYWHDSEIRDLRFLFTRNPNKVKLEMVMNKYTGPGRLRLEILTEANVSVKLNPKITT